MCLRRLLWFGNADCRFGCGYCCFGDIHHGLKVIHRKFFQRAKANDPRIVDQQVRLFTESSQGIIHTGRVMNVDSNGDSIIKAIGSLLRCFQADIHDAHAEPLLCCLCGDGPAQITAAACYNCLFHAFIPSLKLFFIPDQSNRTG